MMLTIEAEDAWWPPTFTPELRRAHLVGVVDDAHRQPQHTALDRLQSRRVCLLELRWRCLSGHLENMELDVARVRKAPARSGLCWSGWIRSPSSLAASTGM